MFTRMMQQTSAFALYAQFITHQLHIVVGTCSTFCIITQPLTDDDTCAHPFICVEDSARSSFSSPSSRSSLTLPSNQAVIASYNGCHDQEGRSGLRMAAFSCNDLFRSLAWSEWLCGNVAVHVTLLPTFL